MNKTQAVQTRHTLRAGSAARFCHAAAIQLLCQWRKCNHGHLEQKVRTEELPPENSGVTC